MSTAHDGRVSTRRLCDVFGSVRRRPSPRTRTNVQSIRTVPASRAAPPGPPAYYLWVRASGTPGMRLPPIPASRTRTRKRKAGDQQPRRGRGAGEEEMPSPGGQVSGMAGEKCWQFRFVGGSGCVPSHLTSPRAITPRQGGKPGNVPHHHTQVAPLTQRDRATPGQTGWNTRTRADCRLSRLLEAPEEPSQYLLQFRIVI